MSEFKTIAYRAWEKGKEILSETEPARLADGIEKMPLATIQKIAILLVEHEKLQNDLAEKKPKEMTIMPFKSLITWEQRLEDAVKDEKEFTKILEKDPTTFTHSELEKTAETIAIARAQIFCQLPYLEAIFKNPVTPEKP